MNSRTPAPVSLQSSKASVPLLLCRAAARQRRRDFPVSLSVSHTHTDSPRRLSALSREYFSYFPTPYLQKQESRVPYSPRSCPLPYSSCPPSQMMPRLGAMAARGLNPPSRGSRWAHLAHLEHRSAGRRHP